MLPRIIQWLFGKNIGPDSAVYELHFRISDILHTILITVCATVLGIFFQKFGFSDATIITVYILAVQIIAVHVTGALSNAVVSLVYVALFNFFFTDPKYTFFAYGQDYPITFIVMFIVAFLAGTIAEQLKKTVRQSERNRLRTQLLYDTSQLLNKSHELNEAAEVVGIQLYKLFDKDIVVAVQEPNGNIDIHFYPETCKNIFDNQIERDALIWTLRSQKDSGAATSVYPGACSKYYTIGRNEYIHGAIGINIPDGGPDQFSESIMKSILNQCELVMENIIATKEKEDAALRAQNEKLKADLLRAISHDLRTPLTSISGNASILLNSKQNIDDETKNQLYNDIYDDSIWLIDLIENLLAVSRTQGESVKLNLTTEVLEDVIDEALQHIDRHSSEHSICVEKSSDMILVQIDVRLLVQVIINLLNNSIKYSPSGSKIVIKTEKLHDMAYITVCDNGPGISPEDLPHVFEMFYNGSKKVADARKSMGLGLALCKSIIEAHGGQISVSNIIPHGAKFRFSLPAKEIDIDESQI